MLVDIEIYISNIIITQVDNCIRKTDSGSGSGRCRCRGRGRSRYRHRHRGFFLLVHGIE